MRVFKSNKKSFCEYKHLSWITLNNKHFWLRQYESVTAETLMGVKSANIVQPIFPQLQYFKSSYLGIMHMCNYMHIASYRVQDLTMQQIASYM